jgi:hypothetical protein
MSAHRDVGRPSKEDVTLQQASDWLNEERQIKRRNWKEGLQKNCTEFSDSNFVISCYNNFFKCILIFAPTCTAVLHEDLPERNLHFYEHV